MQKFSCKDLGVDCDFTTTAASREEVKKATFAHAEVAHKDMLQSMTAEQMAEFQTALDGAIKPA